MDEWLDGSGIGTNGIALMMIAYQIMNWILLMVILNAIDKNKKG